MMSMIKNIHRKHKWYVCVLCVALLADQGSGVYLHCKETSQEACRSDTMWLRPQYRAQIHRLTGVRTAWGLQG